MVGNMSARAPKRSGKNTAYVYQVVVDGVVRYVGKGRDGRVYSHLIAARRVAGRSRDSIQSFPFLRQKLVEAVRHGALIEETILVCNLADDEAYRTEQQTIGTYHKQHPGQLWNTIDERFMDAGYLPNEWENPIHPNYKVPRPLTETIDYSTGQPRPLFVGQVPFSRRQRKARTPDAE